jgi:hypothetical protein
MVHLQGSFHSAIQDIREILGLGRVHYGFDVTNVNNGQISINPGLAFDFHKNRICLDEANVMAIDFAEGQKIKFVCLKYAQVEEGQVEDHFTIIWDSCMVILQDSQPGVTDNMITIARLEKNEQGGLQIYDLVERHAAQQPAKTNPPDDEQHSDATDSGAAAHEPGQTGQDDSTAPSIPAQAGNEQGATEPPGLERVAGESEESAQNSTQEAAESAQPLEPATVTEIPAVNLQVMQGIVQLPQDSDHLVDLASLVLPRFRIGNAGSADSEPIRFPLASEEIALEFPVVSLSCYTTMACELFWNASGSDAAVVRELAFKSTAQGEVIFVKETVSQYGVSTVQNTSTSPVQEKQEICRLGVASLDFLLTNDGSELLEKMQILTEVRNSGPHKLEIKCHLQWQGGADDRIIEQLQIQGLKFKWRMILAWKALSCLLPAAK